MVCQGGKSKPQKIVSLEKLTSVAKLVQKSPEMLTIQNSSAGQTTFFGRTNAKKVVSWQDKCQKSSILAGQIPKSSILVGQMPFW